MHSLNEEILQVRSDNQLMKTYSNFQYLPTGEVNSNEEDSRDSNYDLYSLFQDSEGMISEEQEIYVDIFDVTYLDEILAASEASTQPKVAFDELVKSTMQCRTMPMTIEWVAAPSPLRTRNLPDSDHQHFLLPEATFLNNSEQSERIDGSKIVKKRVREMLTADQHEMLEASFRTSVYLTDTRRKSLSQTLGINERRIQVWFQNRRCKQRKLARRNEHC